MKKILTLSMVVLALLSSVVYGMPGASENDELTPRTGLTAKRKASDISSAPTGAPQTLSTEEEAPSAHRSLNMLQAQGTHHLPHQNIAPLTPEEREELNQCLIGMGFKTEFAIPTTDTGFKHLLALDEDNKNVVISFLNTFIPPFRGDPVVTVKSAPTAIPPLPRPGQKQTFMDMHVTS